MRTVTLGDLYPGKSQFMPTSSHLAWVRSAGINQANQLIVELVNGKRVVSVPDTGQTLMDGL